MTTYEILEALDGQISRLQEARLLLASVEQQVQRSSSRGKGEALQIMLRGSLPTSKKRTMSAEGRARIAAAQRARWAKRAATTPSASKPSSATEAPARRQQSAEPKKATSKSPRRRASVPSKSTPKK